MGDENKREEDWTRGYRTGWTRVLQEACSHLGYETDEAGKASWIVERERTVAMLRQICEQFGDNDWDVSLNLPDIIEKHLWRNLE